MADITNLSPDFFFCWAQTRSHKHRCCSLGSNYVTDWRRWGQVISPTTCLSPPVSPFSTRFAMLGMVRCPPGGARGRLPGWWTRKGLAPSCLLVSLCSSQEVLLHSGSSTFFLQQQLDPVCSFPNTLVTSAFLCPLWDSGTSLPASFSEVWVLPLWAPCPSFHVSIIPLGPWL